MTKIKTIQVAVHLDEEYAKEFHSRCIKEGTTMSAVMRDGPGIKPWMETHPQKIPRNEGIQ